MQFGPQFSHDNCLAKISNLNPEKLGVQNMRITIENNQVTVLLDSRSVCSIVTKGLGPSIIDNYKETKWFTE